MNEILVRLTISGLFTLFIAIFLIFFIKVRKKKGKKGENNNLKVVDFGQIYIRNCFCTFLIMAVLCHDFIGFILFQVCLIFASIINANYINNKLHNIK